MRFFTLLKLFKFRYLWLNRSFSPQNNLFPSKVLIPIFNKNWIFDFNESDKIIYTLEICHVISDILREISSCLLTAWQDRIECFYHFILSVFIDFAPFGRIWVEKKLKQISRRNGSNYSRSRRSRWHSGLEGRAEG